MKKGYMYILLSTVLFSTMEIALKVVSNQFNPIQMNFLRFLIGAVILLPLAVKGLKARKVLLKREDFTFFALTGFICVVVSMMFYQMAILYAPASVVAVLFSCNPVFVILFAFMILGEKIYKHTIISIIFSLTGILVIMDPLHMNGSITGIILTILAAVTFALYGVVGRTRSAKYGGVALTCFSFLCGSAEMLMIMLLAHIYPVNAFLTRAGFKLLAGVPIVAGINLQDLPALIYIGIFVTGLGYTFYFLAMEATSAATASLVFYIKPVLAPVFALVFLGEPITVPMGIGIMLIISGSLTSFIPEYVSKRQKEGINVNGQESRFQQGTFPMSD